MRILVSIAIAGGLAAAPAGADDLSAEYRQAFRGLDAPARLALVEKAAAAGDLAGAKVLLEILRRDDEGEERALYRKRDSIGGTIDGIFDAAIRDKRMLTPAEDERLQGVKRELAAVVSEIAAVVEVRWRAAEALEGMSDRAVREHLLEVAGKDRDWFVRYAAVRAVGRDGEPEPAPALTEIVAKEASSMVVVAALDALGRLKAPIGAAAAIEKLDSPDWPVRAAAAAALARMGDLGAVRPMIDRMAKEKGRLRTDLDRALETLTGFSTGGDAARWEGWWKVHGAAVEARSFVRAAPEKGGQPASGVTFYGVRTLSDRIVFVLDISGSMKEPAGAKVPVTGTSDRVVQPEGDRKIDVARAQLKTAILALPERAEFNVIFYRQGVRAMSARMVRADPRSVEKAFAFIDDERPAGGTNIFDALHQAFNPVEVVDSGARITSRNWDGLVDTVFLLSDGQPNYGRFTSAGEMVRELTRLDVYRKIVVHAIGIGDHDESFLKDLAASTGGEYAGFE